MASVSISLHLGVLHAQAVTWSSFSFPLLLMVTLLGGSQLNLQAVSLEAAPSGAPGLPLLPNSCLKSVKASRENNAERQPSSALHFSLGFQLLALLSPWFASDGFQRDLFS